MSNLFKIALVGRPNVGKSALFNRICKRRIAIVDEAVGITRDRLYAEADFFGTPFQVIDTGGIDPISNIPFYEEVRLQTEIAIEEANVLIFVVDSLVGITALDEFVAKFLLKTKKKVILAVNKIDDISKAYETSNFYSLGISEVVAVSASQGFQIAELLEAAFKGEEISRPHEKSSSIRIAIVGRPNVGKSTLINALLDEKRCVVSPIAGTTRDSIDTEIIKDDISFTLIDTAGIRRKKSEHEVVDKFAAIRTEKAIQRADICLLVMDATQGMTVQEKKIAEFIESEGKGCILLLNKWDQVKGFRMEHCEQAIRMDASFLSHCQTLFISAQTGRNLNEIFPAILEVNKQRELRITTGQLNTFIEKVFQKVHPPMIQGKRLRVYYMTQVQTAPPRFIMFVNFPDLMLESYKKYMINEFRKQYPFTGVPLVFDLKGKQEKSEAPKKAEQEPVEAPDLQEELDSSYFI